MESEYFAGLKVLYELLIVNFDFSDTLTLEFFAADNCSINPIEYFLYFFVTIIENFFLPFFHGTTHLGIIRPFKFVSLLNVGENLTRPQLLLKIAFRLLNLIAIFALVVVQIEGNGQTIYMNIFPIIFMDIPEYA